MGKGMAVSKDKLPSLQKQVPTSLGGREKEGEPRRAASASKTRREESVAIPNAQGRGQVI